MLRNNGDMMINLNFKFVSFESSVSTTYFQYYYLYVSDQSLYNGSESAETSLIRVFHVCFNNSASFEITIYHALYF